MRHVLPVLALVASLFAAPGLPALAADSEFHTCPDNAEARVSHTGSSEWIATTQSSRPRELRIEIIGRNPALVCVYRMFGTDYWIYRYPSAHHPNCTVSSEGGTRGFYCLR